MSHIFRFFGTPVRDSLWEFSEFERDHARKVLKVKNGDAVEVMDGLGSVASGAIIESSRDKIVVKPSNVDFFERSSTRKALAIGALKPGSLDDILPGLVELGLDEIIVFQQSDTAKYRTSESAKERWQRIIVAAVKQCKRTWVPNLVLRDSLELAIEGLAGFELKFVLEATATRSLLELAQTRVQTIAAVVGGERGLNSAELKACEKCGFIEVSAGEYILRAKTAALSVSSVMALMK